MRSVLFILFVSSALVSTSAVADGDAAAGQKIFQKCAICHSPEAGVNKVGPSLHGVVGRPSATIADYQYSTAMKGANKVWDAKELNVYLTDPHTEVPGTKMIFPGLKDETDRQNIIAYLSTLK